MLYAASVKISQGRNRRRLDVIIAAENLEEAKEKALKQARHIYTPTKKATYTINQIIDETEALAEFSPLVAEVVPDPEA